MTAPVWNARTERQRADFKEYVIERLEYARQTAALSDPTPVALFLEMVELDRRWHLARKAFPGMPWEEFCKIDAERSQPPKKPGRPPSKLLDRANTPVALAARDVEFLRVIFKDLQPAGSRSKPPVGAESIAAELHGIDEEFLRQHMDRPHARRPEKLVQKDTRPKTDRRKLPN